MIPRTEITHWSAGAPWPSELQVEQDLVLSRLIVEIANVEETEPFLDRVHLPYAVASPWYEGEADVSTFQLDELMATKLRALYQRRKGRDLFDLWHVLVALDPDDDRIVAGLEHYMPGDAFTFPQLVQNLRAKLRADDFGADLDTLVTSRPKDYVLNEAADLVMERLGRRLRNAPNADDVRGGAWRL